MIARRVLLGILAAALLAGCGSPSPAPTETVPTQVAPPTSTTVPAVALPWPGPDAEQLQSGVDDGSQPWLLDPSDVALAYASAAHGWDAAQVVASSDGGTVDVTGPEDERRTLTLSQPGLTGPTGVWVVTDDRPTP